MKTLQTHIDQLLSAKITDKTLKKICAFLERRPSLIPDVTEAFKSNYPTLYKSQTIDMIQWLKEAWKGRSNTARKEHPYLVEDIHQIKNAAGILVVGLKVETKHDVTFVRPIFAVLTTKGVIGFQFYMAGDKPVITRKKLKQHVPN